MQRPSLGTKACLPGKNIWYGEDPYYIYYPADQYEDDLRNGVGSDVADLILNVKDVLVKNGAWNLTGAEQTFYDQLDKMNNDRYSNDIDRAKGTNTSAEVKAEASKFVQQHLERFKKDIKGRRAPVVPELLRTLVFARPCGGDQFAAGTVSPSLDMSR